MLNEEITKSLRPGDYSFDNSAHKYKRKLKGHYYTIIGYEWNAISSKNTSHHGIAKTKEEAEIKAKYYSSI